MSEQILQRLAIAATTFVLAGGILAGLLQEPNYPSVKNLLSFVLGASFAYIVVLLWYDLYPAVQILRHRRKVRAKLNERELRNEAYRTHYRSPHSPNGLRPSSVGGQHEGSGER